MRVVLAIVSALMLSCGGGPSHGYVDGGAPVETPKIGDLATGDELWDTLMGYDDKSVAGRKGPMER